MLSDVVKCCPTVLINNTVVKNVLCFSCDCLSLVKCFPFFALHCQPLPAWMLWVARIKNDSHFIDIVHSATQNSKFAIFNASIISSTKFNEDWHELASNSISQFIWMCNSGTSFMPRAVGRSKACDLLPADKFAGVEVLEKCLCRNNSSLSDWIHCAEFLFINSYFCSNYSVHQMKWPLPSIDLRPAQQAPGAWINLLFDSLRMKDDVCRWSDSIWWSVAFQYPGIVSSVGLGEDNRRRTLVSWQFMVDCCHLSCWSHHDSLSIVEL